MKAANIGTTIRRRLQEIGIRTTEDIRRLGPGEIYRSLSARQPGSHLPVCYYLYSLQGAVEGRDWRSFSEEEKQALRRSAGIG
jgi:DNA transformation protein